MHARRFDLSSDRRPGVTLLEVLLTLCLLVVIASLTWPLLTGPLDNERLRQSAEQLRTRWCQLRVESMSTGHGHHFYYIAESDRYFVEKFADETVLPADESQVSSVTAQFDVPSRITEGKLPQGVTFAAPDADDDSSQSAVAAAELLPEFASEQPLDDGQFWLGPITFHADGTTSNARVVLKNENDRCVEVQLRGITGVVKVGRARSIEEPTP